MRSRGHSFLCWLIFALQSSKEFAHLFHKPWRPCYCSVYGVYSPYDRAYVLLGHSSTQCPSFRHPKHCSPWRWGATGCVTCGSQPGSRERDICVICGTINRSYAFGEHLLVVPFSQLSWYQLNSLVPLFEVNPTVDGGQSVKVKSL